MSRRQRIGKRALFTLMVGTVMAVVGYGTAVAANVAGTSIGDPENPNPSPSPSPSYVLSVQLHGAGSVTSHPAAIECGSVCDASFPAGMQVTLTAHPSPSSAFGHWEGACSGTGSCVATMIRARSVTAVFGGGAMEHLSVARKGHGRVTSSGIHCPGDCVQNYAHGRTVKLARHAASGWRFARWRGACHGRHGCMVRMQGARHVRAVFVRRNG